MVIRLAGTDFLFLQLAAAKVYANFNYKKQTRKSLPFILFLFRTGMEVCSLFNLKTVVHVKHGFAASW